MRTSSFWPKWAKLNILWNRNERVAITDALISKDVRQVCGVCLPLLSWDNVWVHFGLRQTFLIQSWSNVIRAQAQWHWVPGHVGPQAQMGPRPNHALGPTEIWPRVLEPRALAPGKSNWQDFVLKFLFWFTLLPLRYVSSDFDIEGVHTILLVLLVC